MVGTASEDEVRANADWIEAAIDEELLAGVRAVLDPIRDQTWPSGRPENQ